MATMSRWSNRKCSFTCSGIVFGLWGLTVHLILLWGVLDINFHSPIIPGLPAVPGPAGAPAKRLLLFVADGLRFETFMDLPPKFLHSIMKFHGSWGISFTRVPTESRPGNVAIAAGLYEDPSAIFKGWKENPVDFDSVFNRSRFTWAWGSPDIIPMFTKGCKGNMHGESYPAEWQDFKEDSVHLDKWVFDKYLEWLNSEGDKVKDLDGIVFFFHLLGCDTAGHYSKPLSGQYIENMKFVDQRIEEIVEKTEKFFGNGSTAYIFTSDHGMTDWGSHGGGSDNEIYTPLVVWGAGVNRNKDRADVEQADITPLMSSLLGISIPVNNEGVLPKDYLSIYNKEYKVHALLANLKQLMQQVKANRMMNCEVTSDQMSWREKEIQKKIEEIETHLMANELVEAIFKSDKALSFAKESLLYFRRYQRIRFLVYLSVMWFSWITILCLRIIGTPRQKINDFLFTLTNIASASILIVILLVHNVSDCENWRLPCYKCLAVISVWVALQSIITASPNVIIQNSKNFLVEIAAIVFLLTTMFTGLTYRVNLSLGMLFIAFIQRVLLKRMNNFFLCTTLILAVFPMLPVVEPRPRVYVVLGSICFMMLVIMMKEKSKYQKVIQIGRLLITALIYVHFIDGRFLPSWFILATTPLCIWISPAEPLKRIEAIAIALFCPFVLLSASYEPLFLIALVTHLLCWLKSPNFTQKNNEILLTTEDLMKATFLMLYTLLSFFGTGNMASISSFNPSWTRHFVTIFSPFTMFSLIFFKLSIPLILIGCVTYKIGSFKIFLSILFLGDCLTLPLVYNVTPYGSWLEIGSAISRFIIAITLPCLLSLLCCLAYPLMRISINPFRSNIDSEKKHTV